MAVVAFAHGGGPGTGWYRVEQPARWLQANGVECRVIHGRDKIERGTLAGVTTFVIQRGKALGVVGAVAALKSRGVRCIYEIDDDLWSLPEWNEARSQFGPDVLGRMGEIIRACDGVTVSTEQLGRRVVELGAGRVYVVPNGVPLDLVPPVGPRTRPGVRVGWFGSRTHEGDLALVVSVLKRLLEARPDVTLVFLGDTPKALWPAGRVEAYNGVAPTAYYTALRHLELDVLVAPLAYNDFNRATGATKILEGGALGLAIVASDVGPYKALRHGVTGMLATGNDQDAWFCHLMDVVGSEGLRQALGGAARAWVEQEHSMASTGPLWREALA